MDSWLRQMHEEIVRLSVGLGVAEVEAAEGTSWPRRIVDQLKALNDELESA